MAFWNKAAKESAQSWTEAMARVWMSWMALMGFETVPNANGEKPASDKAEEKQKVRSHASDSPTVESSEANSVDTSSDQIPAKTAPADESDLLKQQLEAKDRMIKELQERLAVEQKLPKERIESYEALQQQLEAKERDISYLQQQLEVKERDISYLQNQLAFERKLAKEKAESYGNLQQQCEQQAKLIVRLKSQVAELQSPSAIASWQLNKWRYRTFSS
ncbi:hypothetical protein [Pleurocapsa sp. PCC 7327]|uniref:hypothetical protein n=1 Tax=Pleurocapsa sp. PCC 7327 TaxID=118163 RepID=UPI0002D52226|nr:hypothetical protein [Pleurocapsa sp. PCC 7327]